MGENHGAIHLVRIAIRAYSIELVESHSLAAHTSPSALVDPKRGGGFPRDPLGLAAARAHYVLQFSTSTQRFQDRACRPLLPCLAAGALPVFVLFVELAGKIGSWREERSGSA